MHIFNRKLGIDRLRKRQIKRQKNWRETSNGEENRPTIKDLYETLPGIKSGKMYQSPHQFEALLLNKRQLEIVASLSEEIVASSVTLTDAYWT